MSFRKLRKRFVEWFGYGLFTPVRWCVEAILKKLGLVVIYRINGTGLGDTVVGTTLLAALHQQRGVRGITFSKFPQVFQHNPLVAHNLDYERMPKLARSLLKSFCKYMRGRWVICIGAEMWTPGTLPWQTQPPDRFNPWYMVSPHNPDYMDNLQPDRRHRIETRGFLPCFGFSAEEQRTFAERFAALPARFGVVKATSGVNRQQAMTLKDWSVEGMQEVVRRHPEITWVQIGDKGEPVLESVVDLVGQTSLREAFYLLTQASLTLTVEGMISHVAAASGRPVVVVFSGVYHAPGFFYRNTVPVMVETPPPCMPCWQNQCTMPGKPCTSNISVEQVSNAVSKAWATISADERKATEAQCVSGT